MTISLLVWLFLLVADIGPGERAAPDECRYDSSMAVTKPLDDLISPEDPVLGNPDGEVILVEYFDPNCIHCRSLQPVMEEVLERYGDRIRYYRRPFALTSHSVMQVAAMLIAESDGKFYEMAERQLESPNFPYLSQAEIVAMADSIGLDAEAFASELESGAHLNRVQLLRAQAREAGVRGTPTLVINEPHQVVSWDSRTVECISGFIEEALQDRS